MVRMSDAARSWHTRLDDALAVGTLTTIATGGALLGLGWREGEVGRLFRLAGRGLLERLSVASGAAPLTSVALGYLHHLLVATLWGMLFGLCLQPWGRRLQWTVAPVLALGYLLVSVAWLPSVLRIGFGVTANPPSAVPVALALAAALLGGLWCLHRADD